MCFLSGAAASPEVVRELVVVDTSNTAAPAGPAAGEETSAACAKELDWEAWKCRIRSVSVSPRSGVRTMNFSWKGKYMSLLPKSQQTVAKRKAGAGGELATTEGFGWQVEGAMA